MSQPVSPRVDMPQSETVVKSHPSDVNANANTNTNTNASMGKDVDASLSGRSSVKDENAASLLLPECHILAGTWNVGNALEGFKEINRWLGRIAASIKAAIPNPSSSSGPHGNSRVPDMIVFGLQEWSGMFRTTHPKLEDWCEELQIALEQYFPSAQYNILRYHQWVGLVLFIAVRTPTPTLSPSSQLYLTAMTQSTIGLGPLWMGNKGALGLMLHCTFGPVAPPPTLTPSSADAGGQHRRIKICFVNSHLAAQKYRLGLRRTHYHKICETLLFPNPLVSDFYYRSQRPEEADLEAGKAGSGPRQASVGPVFNVTAGKELDGMASKQAPGLTSTSTLLAHPSMGQTLFDADVVFWLGDLNYRLYDPSFFVEGNQIQELLPGDMLGVPNVVRVSPRPNPHFKVASSSGSTESGSKIVNDIQPSHNLPLTSAALQLPPDVVLPELDDAIDTVAHRASPLSTTPRSFYPTLTECLYSRQWDRLLSYDQLYFEMRTKLAFSIFKEPRVSFPPTYKYARGTDYLNIENWKRHWPAWCDRILYYARKGASESDESWTVQPILYDSCPIIVASDHKPVHAYFKISLSLTTLASRSRSRSHSHSQTTLLPAIEEQTSQSPSSSPPPPPVRLFAPFSPASPSLSKSMTESASSTMSELEKKHRGSYLDAAGHWIGYRLSNLLMVPRLWLILFTVLFVLFITLLVWWAMI